MPIGPTQGVLGNPGLRPVSTAEFRRVLSSTSPLFLPGGKFLNGIKSRDPGNTPNTDSLRAGLILGLITGGDYANSVIGTTTGALAAGGTTITVSVASAVELVRRVGASGNLTLTGPPVANAVPSQVVTAYSAVNTTNGQITITAPVGTNQVDQIQLNIASTGGNITFSVQKPDGTFATTANAAYSATDATYLAAINTQLDATTGVVGGIVASAIPSVDTDLGFRLTYSGGAYAGRTWTQATVVTFPTSSTAASYSRLTSAAGQSQFIAGSWVGDTDGSQVPKIILPDGPAIPVADTANTNGILQVQLPQVPVAAIVDVTQVVDYPTDAGFKTWLKQQFNALATGTNYIFSDGY